MCLYLFWTATEWEKKTKRRKKNGIRKDSFKRFIRWNGNWTNYDYPSTLLCVLKIYFEWVWWRKNVTCVEIEMKYQKIMKFSLNSWQSLVYVSALRKCLYSPVVIVVTQRSSMPKAKSAFSFSFDSVPGNLYLNLILFYPMWNRHTDTQ